jgi:putative FmdB family regulatory protein
MNQSRNLSTSTGASSAREQAEKIVGCLAKRRREVHNFCREVLMPLYEYYCEQCKKEFELALTLNEHDHEEKIKCPKCGSHKFHQVAAAFTAVTSKKS